MERAFMIWSSSYYEHPDLASRDAARLVHHIPAIDGVPSIYRMSAEQRTGMVEVTEGVSMRDIGTMLYFTEEFKTCTCGVIFDNTSGLDIKDRIGFLTGSNTMALSYIAHWSCEDEDKARGGGFIKFKFVEGGNHLVSGLLPSAAT